jgi:hypothetical protein
MASGRVGAGARVRGAGRACGRAIYSCTRGNRRIFLYTHQLSIFSCQSPLAEKIFLLCLRNKCLRQAAMPMSRGIPHVARWVCVSVCLRHVAQPDQNETGSLGRKNNMPPARPASKPFRQGIILVADRLDAGLCWQPHGSGPGCYAGRPYTVYGIL